MSLVLLTPPRILLVRFRSVRGIVLATPLLRAIRTEYPEAEITFLTSRRYAPLVSDNPHVDEVVTVGRGLPLVSVARRLRPRSYSHLLDLEGSARTAVLRLLLPGSWSGYPKHRIKRSLLIHTGRDLYRDHIPVAERYFLAAKELEVVPDGKPPELFLSEGIEEQVAAWADKTGIGKGRAMVAFAPGAGKATRRWPLDDWVRLGKALVGTGADIVMVGSPDDAQLAAEVAFRIGPRAASAAGELSLQGSCALLKQCAALITVDNGVLHLATAVGTPVVGLFGPTVRQFGFFPYNAHSAVVERDLKCRPCSVRGGRKCPLKHHHCLRTIAPDDVFNVLTRTLS